VGCFRCWRVVVTLAFALLAGACVGEDLPLVETARATTGEVSQTVSAPARVAPAARQDVAAGVSGRVVALDAADGAQVAAGQPIVRLDSEQVDLALEQAAAARDAAGATTGIAIDGQGEDTRAAAHAAAAQLDAAVQPQLAQARAQAQRVEDPQQRAAALAAVEAVEAAYRSTRQALLAAGHAGAAQQEAAAAALSEALSDALRQVTQPQRVQAEAAAALAAARADELVVAAPFAGTLALGAAAASDGAALPGGLPAEAAGALGALASGGAGEGGGTLRVGAPVVAGQTLFTVYDLSSLYVTADVDEVDAPQVQVGQRAVVLVDAVPDTEFAGVVEQVAIEAETTAAGGVGYPARIRLIGPVEGAFSVPEGEGLDGLRVGMTASAQITTKTVEGALVVPSRALLREGVAGPSRAEGDGSVVFAVRDGRVDVVPVEVDALGEDDAAVRGALQPDERVVVAGYEDLDDGDEVEATRAQRE
jgi:multidrug efflux pump subunit AcrA (membrane-fusion protein)